MKLKRSSQEQLWSEAQRRCPLSDEVVRLARELRLSPRSLIKNIPSLSQQWKGPVEDWVRDIYANRHGAKSRRGPESPGRGPPQVEGKP